MDVNQPQPNSIQENELTHRLKSSQTAGKRAAGNPAWAERKPSEAKQSEVQPSLKFSIPVYFKATDEVKPYSSIIASVAAVTVNATNGTDLSKKEEGPAKRRR